MPLLSMKLRYVQPYQHCVTNMQRSAVEGHGREIVELREMLKTTHEQQAAAHAAELDALRAQQATLLSEANAVTAVELRKLEDDLVAAREAAEQGSKSLETAVKAQSAAEESVSQLQAELEALKAVAEKAQKEVDAQGGSEDVGKLRKVIEDVKDELEGTKEVSYTRTCDRVSCQILEMNKAHFEESLKAIQEDHSAEVAKIQGRADEASRAMEEHDAEVQKLQNTILSLKREVEDEKVAKQTALAKLAVCCDFDYPLVEFRLLSSSQTRSPGPNAHDRLRLHRCPHPNPDQISLRQVP